MIAKVFNCLNHKTVFYFSVKTGFYNVRSQNLKLTGSKRKCFTPKYIRKHKLLEIKSHHRVIITFQVFFIKISSNFFHLNKSPLNLQIKGLNSTCFYLEK